MHPQKTKLNKKMKRILFLSVLLLAALQTVAAEVDVNTAQATAARFLRAAAGTTLHGAPAANSDIRLAHTELNSNQLGQAVYYIFNTSNSYIIVSGDDRAANVLAYGDAPLDMNNIPENMQFWLTGYKEQIEYLQAHPDFVPQNRIMRAPKRSIESVSPLTTALWDQGTPYNNHCPEYNGSRSVTGCGATAVAIIFNYWKWPVDPTPVVQGYTTQSVGLQLEDLPPITFDWDNMLDHYDGGYNEEQSEAVAWLMRYIGQSEHMDYSPSSSGASTDGVMRPFRIFGYDPDVRVVFKDGWWSQSYNDEQWGEIIQEELENARPIVMCAYTPTWEGHAFVIDGFDASNDTYHINWGWGGTGNSYFVLNAFNGGGSLFNMFQQLVIGIEPPTTEPTIKPWLSRVNTKAFVDSISTASFYVRGSNLENDITLTLNDESGFFSIDTEHIGLNELEWEKRVNVTYHPNALGVHTATVTLSSGGAEDKTVTLTGTCILETYDPVMVGADDVNASSINAIWEDATPQHNVVSYNLENVKLPFNEVRLEEAFDKSEFEGTSSSDWSSKLDEITQTPGWTGSKIYRNNNNLMIGTSKSKGWLETPAIDMYGNEGVITVKVIATCTGSDTNAPLKISCGSNDTTITLGSEEEEHIVMLPCPENANAKVRMTTVVGKRVILCKFKALAGDDYSPADLTTATYFENITGNSFLLENLASGYYGLRVQALYTDGTLSPWSNRLRLLINWKMSDVNRDGETNIADVNKVIDFMFNEIASPSARSMNDVNGDGEINIADINAIIYEMTTGR